jgi:hypothetical protein
MTRPARIYDGSNTSDWRWGVRHSRLFLLIWSPAPQHARQQRAKLAYAQALDKPIRLLVVGQDRLPEDLCAGYGDLQVARITSPEDGAAQAQVWLVACSLPVWLCAWRDRR